jgi:hypothetical protein
MGLIGLIITLVIVGLGVSYTFLGSSTPLMIENDAPAPASLDLYESLTTEATDIVSTEEERVEAEIDALEENLKPESPLVQPKEADEDKRVTETDIVVRLMNTGFAVPAKARTIDTIVLHSSYNPNSGDPYAVGKLVEIYESYGVSAHYLIDRGGKIFRLVEDQNIAYHAGVSKMPDGRKSVNDFSIGIEIMNKEDIEYTKAQYEAVNTLVGTLKKKYGIKYVVGHGDIAPDRKSDPWNFDWKKLKN